MSKSKHLRGQRTKGFTLIELMVAVAMIAIVMVWAIPSFSDMVARRKVDSGIKQFVASLQLARSQAVTLGRDITICGTTDGATCSSSTALGDKWMVYIPGSGGSGSVLRVLQTYEVPGLNLTASSAITASAIGKYPDGSVTVVPTSGDYPGKKITFSIGTITIADVT